ncbi:MAG: hypothetical protein JNL28_08395 [Planctomycetes bacterium]|nr:hypothetical protein [Planctomycetota bacterium]
MSADTRPRFVVLGASNVSRDLRGIVARARGAQTAPVEILTAHGRGRSYGIPSRFLWSRELEGIDTCGLWARLAARTAATSALVADLGNDLVYGVAPGQIADWIERVLDRLQAAEARSVVVGLPLAGLMQLGSFRFALARHAFFPGREIDLPRLVDAARTLNERLAAAVRSRGAAWIEPDVRWYGLDPIHFRQAARNSAWDSIFAPLSDTVRAQPWAHGERALLASARPAARRLFGREQRCAQPCVRFADGTTVSWY